MSAFSALSASSVLPVAAPRWYVLRHAQPLIAKGICYGQLNVAADAALTQTAAAAFATHLQTAYGARHGAGGSDGAPHGGHALTVRLQCSPLQRCQQLAQALQPLLAVHGVAHHDTDTALTEIDFGQWEGRPWNSIAMSEWDGWQADFAHYRPGGGESVAHFVQRVHAAARQTAGWLQQHPGAVAVWVTHAGIMRALYWLQQRGHVLPGAAAEWPLDGACPCGQWLALDESALAHFFP